VCIGLDTLIEEHQGLIHRLIAEVQAVLEVASSASRPRAPVLQYLGCRIHNPSAVRSPV
jgi:hypothetical protein